MSRNEEYDRNRMLTDRIHRLIVHFENAGAGERAWGANYALMVALGHMEPKQCPIGLANEMRPSTDSNPDPRPNGLTDHAS